MSLYGYPLALLFLAVTAHAIDDPKSEYVVRYNEDVTRENDGTSDRSDEPAEYIQIIRVTNDDNSDIIEASYIYTDDRRAFSPSKTNFLEKSIEALEHEMELEKVDVKDDEFGTKGKVTAENSIPLEQVAYGRKRRSTEDQKMTKPRQDRISINRYKRRAPVKHVKTRRNFRPKNIPIQHHLRQASVRNNRTRPAELRKETVREKVRRKHLQSEENKNGAGKLLFSKENGHDRVDTPSREAKGHNSENTLQRERRDTDATGSGGIRRYYGRSRKCNMAWRQARKALESCGAEMNTISTRDETTGREEAEGNSKVSGIWTGEPPKPPKDEGDEKSEKEGIPQTKEPPVGEKDSEDERKSEDPKTDQEKERKVPEGPQRK